MAEFTFLKLIQLNMKQNEMQIDMHRRMLQQQEDMLMGQRALLATLKHQLATGAAPLLPGMHHHHSPASPDHSIASVESSGSLANTAAAAVVVVSSSSSSSSSSSKKRQRVTEPPKMDKVSKSKKAAGSITIRGKRRRAINKTLLFCRQLKPFAAAIESVSSSSTTTMTTTKAIKTSTSSRSSSSSSSSSLSSATSKSKEKDTSSATGVSKSAKMGTSVSTSKGKSSGAGVMVAAAAAAAAAARKSVEPGSNTGDIMQSIQENRISSSSPPSSATTGAVAASIVSSRTTGSSSYNNNNNNNNSSSSSSKSSSISSSRGDGGTSPRLSYVVQDDDNVAVLNQLKDMHTYQHKLRAAKFIYERLDSYENEMVRMLGMGGAAIFFNWLTESKAFSDDKATGEDEAALVSFVIGILDKAPWTPTTIKQCRFDKLLRRLFKKYTSNADAESQAVAVVLKSMWNRYRVMYKEQGGDEADVYWKEA